MQCNSSSHWFRAIFILFLTASLSACGTGDGEEVFEDSAADVQAQELRLVFEDDFGGPSGSPRLAAKEALTVDSKWRAVTGYGPNNDGWFNDEWQLYQNSIDNLYTENGNLVIEVLCPTAPTCGKRDGTITSARVMTKDRLEVQYGVIQARIKVPGGDGMWPAFWMLGENWPETNWPLTGEIDIMEMLYDRSDRFTSHFTIHWADDDNNNAATNDSGTYVSDVPLTDDFHVYEVDWNEDRIIGKIDGITYFTKTIDPATMTEFKNEFFLLLNVAAGGAGGTPNASTTYPQQMLVDWVRVFEREPATSASLTTETEVPLDYIRIIQSQEFGNANVTIAKVDSTAVPALEGSEVLEVQYTNTRTGLSGGPAADYGGIFITFGGSNLSNFTNFILNVDSSQFTDFDDLTLEFKDLSDTVVQVKLSDFTPVSTSGNWTTYNIPLSSFAGVDLGRILHLGLIDAEDDTDQLLTGTLYFDDLRFTTEACTPNPSIAFDAVNYNPAESAAIISVDDLCAANSVVEVKVAVGSDEIVVGVDLDAAGQGSTDINLVSPASFCGTDDEIGSIAFTGNLLATYNGNYLDLDGNPLTASDTASAGLDAGTALLNRVGDSLYVLSSAGIPQTWLPDADYSYSDFGSGATFNTVNDVVTVNGSAGAAALLAFTGFDSGFDADYKSFNTNVKGLPGNILRLKFSDSEGEISIDLATDSRATLESDGSYSVSIPMTDIDATDHTYIMWGSNTSSATDYTFQVTDTFYDEFPPSAGTACSAPADAPAAPTEDSADVISLFSNAYTDVAVDTFSASFTTVSFSEPVLNGNDIKGYSGLATPATSNSFVAIETGTSQVDATSMTNLRIDVWSADVSSLKIKLVDFGSDGFAGTIADVAGEVTKALTLGEWTSLDIPLSEFQAAGLSRQEFISQYILSKDGAAGTIFVDNIYFYEAPLVGSTITNHGRNTGGLFTETITSDTVTYTGIGRTDGGSGSNVVNVDAASTAIASYDGSVSLEIDYTDTGGGYAGAFFTFAGADLTVYNTLNFTINTAAVSDFGDLTIQLEPPAGGTVGGNVQLSAYTPVATSGSWNTYAIPLADFPASTATLNAVTAVGFWNMRNAAGNTTPFTFGKIYVDDVYFSLDGDHGPNTGGLFTETTTSATVTYSGIGRTDGGSGSNVVNVDAASTAVTPYDGTDSLEIEYTDTGGAYAGAFFTFGGADLTAYNTLNFAINTSAVADFGDITIQLEPPAGGTVGGNVQLSAYLPVETFGDWQLYAIPLPDFPASTATLNAVTAVGFWNMRNAAGNTTPFTFGTIYVDDIYFSQERLELITNGGFETGDLTGWLDPAPGAGSLTVTDTESRNGDWSARAQVAISQNVFAQQNGVGLGIVTDGDVIDITFDLKGDLNPGAVINTLATWSGGGGAIAPNITASVADWTKYTYTTTLTGGDLSGGFSLLIEAVCGGVSGCSTDVYIDNVSVKIQ
ncbi:MAG: family 16 glycosylhydrolase [Gammaproteobacteria bacterium]|nr:family 16 glycosylhydrolase [Gammaproteobacteria bacterium]